MFKQFFTFGRVVTVLVIGIFLNLAYIAYLAFFPFKTIEFHNSPFPIVNGLSHNASPEAKAMRKTLKAGDALRYEVDFCRYTDAPVELTRTLTGPTIITIVQDTATADTGCRTVVTSNTVIPDHTPSGAYYLKITACYQVNPLRNICHQVGTQYFDVVEEDK